MFTDAGADLSPALGRGGSSATYSLMTKTDETSLATLSSRLQPDEIVFDPASTINLFHNEGLLDGAAKEASMGGISTCGGTASATKKGTYRGLETYLNPEGPANLLSQAVLRRDGARISLDDVNDEYTVTYPDGDVQAYSAREDLGGLYTTKQKLNTRSSTESELVGISDALTTVVWMRDFLLGQGYEVGPAVMYQDNMSTIALVENGRALNEGSRHINISSFLSATV